MKKKTLPMNLQFFAESTGGEPQNPAEPQNQNPTPNNPATGTQQNAQHEEPNPGEVTIEGLMAQLAQANALNAKLKADKDKICSSEANLRKQLRAKQTAEEQEAEAKAEQQAQHEEYVKSLEKFKAVTESSERYLSMGMDKDLARATATAEVEGAMDTVTSNLTKFMDERDKKKDEEIRAQYMAQMPIPQSGNVANVDYSSQIKNAMDAGDMQAAALAILQQADANSNAN